MPVFRPSMMYLDFVLIDPLFQHTIKYLLSNVKFWNVRLNAKEMFTISISIWEQSGSVVESLTQDQEFAGSSLTGITALCP